MDVVKRVLDLSEDDLERQIKVQLQVLLHGKRGRDCLEALRKLAQIIYLRPSEIDAQEQLLESLLRVISDEEQSPKIRFLAMSVLNELLDEELPSLAVNLSNLPKTRLIFLLPIALSSVVSFNTNLDNIVSWLIGSQVIFRHITYPAIYLSLKKDPPILSVSRHIKPIENQMSIWLSSASRVSAQATTAVSFIKISSKPQIVTEIDGSPTQDFFTLLNFTQLFTDDQMFNVQTFSLLYSWLSGVYIQKKVNLTSEDTEFTLNSTFQKSITSYCLRVIEQSKLVPTVEVGKDYTKVKDIVVIEAIRILDLLCILDNSLVPQIFPVLHKISAFTMNSQMNDRSTGLLFLAILQFFLNHSEVMSFDPDSIFQLYLTSFVGNNFYDPIIAFETLLFCRKNKSKLLNTTNIFSLYFPPLLKIFAWNPEYYREIKSLLPAIIGPSTYLELFHAILDLPLLTAALVRNTIDLTKMEQDPLNRSGPLPTVPQPTRSGTLPQIPAQIPGDPGKYRALYNYLLRNESGVSVNWWESAREILDGFCKETVISSRIVSVAEHVPELMEIFFTILVSYSDEKTLLQIIPIMFQRMDQLFPLKEFQAKTRMVLVQQILAIFEKHPSFIVKLKDTILTAINDHRPSSKNLILHLCWAIGEYASSSITNTCTPEIINDYDEALELLAFERMSISTSTEDNQSEEDKNHNNTLMSVLISALSKLAARCTPLVSRVSLCLVKLDRYRKFFHPAVIARMEECINILLFPSVAAAILDTRHKTNVCSHHIDKDSSLPFLLQSTGNYISGRKKLHQFENM